MVGMIPAACTAPLPASWTRLAELMPYRTACWNFGLDVILEIFGLSLVSRKNRFGEAPLTICTPDMPCARVGERSTAIWDSPLSTSSFCTLAWTLRITILPYFGFGPQYFGFAVSTTCVVLL